MTKSIYKTYDFNYMIRIWISRASILVLIVILTFHLSQNWNLIFINILLLLIEYFLREDQIVLFQDSFIIKKKYFFNLRTKITIFHLDEIDEIIVQKDDVFDEIKSNISGAYRIFSIKKKNGELINFKLLICLSELNVIKKRIENY